MGLTTRTCRYEVVDVLADRDEQNGAGAVLRVLIGNFDAERLPEGASNAYPNAIVEEADDVLDVVRDRVNPEIELDDEPVDMDADGHLTFHFANGPVRRMSWTSATP